MAAVAANSELCLTDRLTELRQGLSTAAANSQQPNTTVSLLSGSAGSPPYLSVSHAGYGLLSSHPYYNGNGCTASGPSGMYLNPPVVPPSLLYPQLYTSVAHNQLHPSIHILGSTGTPNTSDLLRSPEPSRNEEETLQGGSRNSSTGSAASSNGGSNSSIANLMAQVETTRADSPRQQIQTETNCTTTTNGTSIYNSSTNGHTDSVLWRPY